MFTIDFHDERITSFNKNQTRKIIICVITGGRTSCESARVGTTTLPISASEDVCMTLYSCGWETRFDLNTRKCIILMLCRALRPVSIRTIFRSVSLTTLTGVFQQAYALFNLLNAVWN
uniref:Olfactory receptor n=1 Tax=Bombyx mori TaxID=7091 RepID=C4B7Z7_BOMMO|nr:olfactory receptor [Bombyx mori]